MKCKINGIVEIKNGKNKIENENTIVENGIKSFLNSLHNNQNTDYLEGALHDGWHCEIGDDTSTSTTSDMTSLVNVISSSQDSKSGNISDGSNYYEITYTFTWNSGSVSGTLGECGLFLCTLDKNLDSLEQNLFSRLASADDDFSSFVIDDSKPLTIDWTIRLEFV